MFGVVGILAGNRSKLFFIAISASVQDGVSKLKDLLGHCHLFFRKNIYRIIEKHHLQSNFWAAAILWRKKVKQKS
ncbi:MAG: hypothetical protein WA113_11085 [Desulfitobacteriaceae bacterium]